MGLRKFVTRVFNTEGLSWLNLNARDDAKQGVVVTSKSSGKKAKATGQFMVSLSELSSHLLSKLTITNKGGGVEIGLPKDPTNRADIPLRTLVGIDDININEVGDTVEISVTTHDVTLTGAPDYITIAPDQVITRHLIAEAHLDSAVQIKLNNTAPSNLTATTTPTVGDDDSNTAGNGIYASGSVWIDNTGKEAYRCVDASTGAAIWIETTLTADELGTMAIQNANAVTITGGSITGISDIAIADGGTGASTAQEAIDALTQVSGATDEFVLTKDTGTGNAIWKVAGGGGSEYIVVNSAGTLPTASGVDAISIGETTIASATDTVAIGRSANASISQAVAIGANTTASSDATVSIGYSADAIGQFSMALGNNAQGIGNNSVALGRGAGAQTSSIAIGINSDALGSTAISIGSTAIASANKSISIGSSAGSSGVGNDAIAIGSVSGAEAIGSIAIGNRSKATAQGAIMMGYHSSNQTNSVSDSFELAWDGTTAFKVGTLYGTGITSNADPDTNLTAAVNGVIAYDSTDHEFRAYVNGAWTTVALGGGMTVGAQYRVPISNAGSTDFSYRSDFNFENGVLKIGSSFPATHTYSGTVIQYGSSTKYVELTNSTAGSQTPTNVAGGAGLLTTNNSATSESLLLHGRTSVDSGSIPVSVIGSSFSGGVVVNRPILGVYNFQTKLLEIAADGTATFSEVVNTDKGLKFPATQVASADVNTLDDYEEGTWTPTVTAPSGTVGGITTAKGKYTKIGNLVTVSMTLVAVVKNTLVGILEFSLPFTSSSDADFNPTGSVRYENLVVSTDKRTIYPTIAPNSSKATLGAFTEDGSAGQISDVEAQSVFSIYDMSISYWV